MHTKTFLTIRLSGALGDSVAANVGNEGSCENVSEYIRRDTARAEDEAFHLLKAALTLAFAAPEGSYQPLNAAYILTGNPA